MTSSQTGGGQNAARDPQSPRVAHRDREEREAPRG